MQLQMGGQPDNPAIAIRERVNEGQPVMVGHDRDDAPHGIRERPVSLFQARQHRFNAIGSGCMVSAHNHLFALHTAQLAGHHHKAVTEGQLLLLCPIE